MEEALSEFAGYVVDEVEYERLKSIIEAAKKEETIEVFRLPEPSEVSEEVARSRLCTADESFESQEWVAAMKWYQAYHDLEWGPKSVSSKLSLCLLQNGCDLIAFDLAKQAIIDSPLDSSAYLVIASIKSRLAIRSASIECGRLLQLAELTLNPNPHLIAIISRQNSLNLGIGTFRPVIYDAPILGLTFCAFSTKSARSFQASHELQCTFLAGSWHVTSLLRLMIFAAGFP